MGSLDKSKWITIASISLIACLLSYFLGGMLQKTIVPINHKPQVLSPLDFKGISMGSSIVPALNADMNLVLLQNVTEASRIQNQFSSKVSSQVSRDWNSKVGYFLFQSQAQYFPSLYVDREYVPVGNSNQFCLHLAWIERSKANQID